MVLLDVLDGPLQQLVAVGVVARLGDQPLGGDGGDGCSRSVKLCPHYTSPVVAVFDRQYFVLSVGKTPAVNQILIALLVFSEGNLLPRTS